LLLSQITASIAIFERHYPFCGVAFFKFSVCLAI